MFWSWPSMLKCSQIVAFLGAFIDTLPWTILNVQVNKASSANKEIVKTCLVVDMARKNWLWVDVAGCGLHYFVLARFGSFWVELLRVLVQPKDLNICFL